MFTGIIQGTGRIRHWDPTATSGRMTITSSLPRQWHSRIGDSIAVNGICLTVIDYNDHEFNVDVMPETTQRTNLQQVQPGNTVNIEPALLVTQQLDGHFVLGHVDMTVPVTKIAQEENAVRMQFSLPARYQSEVVEKGSVAVNGVSLTVTAVTAAEFEISLIPHTLQQTNLGQLAVGDLVNVETDVLGKYVNGRMQHDSNPTN
ncbi:riboflavin synthase [Fructilactobacillus hinvesii]|uniref:Riboflavin synthase n=1 Tax=Fructilactobacillus hinvesii TaxID=2940300 RepID=A0ABY5BRZ7_9LACO|nr:riboflavin synthase [Fructilactobacillus hinvesii]USS87735.1 riboflavin synthase [Fructilactobacillus hinvesii]